MILRRAALAFSKPLVDLPFFFLIVAAAVALPALLARAEPVPGAEAKLVDTAKSGPDGDVVTTPGSPRNLSEGRVYDNVYGRPAAGGLQDANPTGLIARIAGVTQPQTAFSKVSGAAPSTSDGQKRQIGMFVLLLITLSAVTLLLWRHARRDYASPRRIGRRI
jgi:hypothetical protein